MKLANECARIFAVMVKRWSLSLFFLGGGGGWGNSRIYGRSLRRILPGGILDISLGGDVRRGSSYPEPV